MMTMMIRFKILVAKRDRQTAGGALFNNVICGSIKEKKKGKGKRKASEASRRKRTTTVRGRRLEPQWQRARGKQLDLSRAIDPLWETCWDPAPLPHHPSPAELDTLTRRPLHHLKRFSHGIKKNKKKQVVPPHRSPAVQQRRLLFPAAQPQQRLKRRLMKCHRRSIWRRVDGRSGGSLN